jgi:glycerol-3-phosphate acyltransferase PlsY
VSTTGGVVFAISPWLGLVAFGLFILILLITRYVSLGSIVCVFLSAFMIFIPHLDYIYLFNNSLLYPENYQPDVLSKALMMCIMLCNALIVIIRHKQNILCLINGKERKFF